MNLSADQLTDMLGSDKIGAFASKLGVGSEDAASGLSNMIPELLDKTSQGGAISNDLIKDIGGSLLGKLF